MSPLQAGVTAVVSGIGNLWDSYVYFYGVKNENRELREEVNVLRTEIQELREELFRAGRLEEFAAYRSETGFEGIVARVIGESPDPWTRTIVVNRGRQEGIRKGSPVVMPDGLVGMVIEVARHSSVVRLIVDRSSRVPVIVNRSRARAILEGENSGTCQLKYLDRTQDVLVGDVIITSGLAGKYPRGVEVGTVTQVIKNSYGLYQYAKVLPQASSGSFEDVLILRLQDRGGGYLP
jgi:rod shape-determining protein MreC